ncbi:MAG: DUF692 family multinuclear iron-containing protein [Bacteroidota bacterium]
MTNILPAIACNLDIHLLQASIPLFAEEKVQAIEWSFDTLFKVRDIPGWFVELLETFGKEGRLVGHGVFFSLFSGKWSPEQSDWLRRLERMSKHFSFDHVTEHFGFMTGADFHKGAPISIPFNDTSLAIGQDRLKRIFNACQCPVGLENLALAYSLEEVKRHGEFLHRLIEPVNGFIILDLHNLYCQLHNFAVDFSEIIELYPLDRVREIHISGGSWESSQISPGTIVRRDTHDEQVPPEVFELLKKAIPLCPNLKFVVLEQLGTALTTAENQERFRTDFYEMEKIIAPFDPVKKTMNNFLPNDIFELSGPLENIQLFEQQMELSAILENSTNYQEVHEKMHSSSLVNSDWEIGKWEPKMLETVYRIAQKWKSGF